MWKMIPETIKKHFVRIISSRRTQRTFTREPVSQDDIRFLLQAAATTPSSCNRQAIHIRLVEERDDKDILSGILVGGVGWCHRAAVLFLIFADQRAYKAGDEVKFMPYLDAGVMIQQLCLSATVANLGIGYVNPNIRESNRELFNSRFNPNHFIYCGALAIGNYDVRSELSPKRNWKEVLL